MMIAVGCDHAGVEVKTAICSALLEARVKIHDFAPLPIDGPLDYPDIAEAVAREVADGIADLGVLICGTGIGMSIAANKIAGARAALCNDAQSAALSREHNDANILCLAGRALSPEATVQILEAWLAATPSTDERHLRRRDKVRAIEDNSARTLIHQ